MTKYLTPTEDLNELKINKSIVDIVDYVDNMFKNAIEI
jgi:hypothetical protein